MCTLSSLFLRSILWSSPSGAKWATASPVPLGKTKCFTHQQYSFRKATNPMNSQFVKNHTVIAVKGQEGRAVRRVTHLGGKIIAAYAEDAVPGTDDVRPVLCALIALPDGTEISPVPESETRLASRANESRFPGEYTLPEGGTEYLVRLRDGIELTFVHHPDVNK